MKNETNEALAVIMVTLATAAALIGIAHCFNVVEAADEPEAPKVEHYVLDTELLHTGHAVTENVDDVNVFDDEQEDFENEKIEAVLLQTANKIDSCTITYYCMERRPHICGTGDGLTACGEPVSLISCAVDPRVIPLGSTVMIDRGDGEIEYRVAQDTGCWVNGAHIDLAVETHSDALQLGREKATVYWIAPEELHEK